MIFWKQLSKMKIARKNLQPIRLCVRHTQSPVGNMYFQPDDSIYTYGALRTVVLSRTYSGVNQLKNEPT